MHLETRLSAYKAEGWNMPGMEKGQSGCCGPTEGCREIFIILVIIILVISLIILGVFVIILTGD